MLPLNPRMPWIFPVVWLLVAGGGYFYARQLGVPAGIILGAMPAFLLEATLYLDLGFDSARSRLKRLPRSKAAAGLTLAAIAPMSSLPSALAALSGSPVHWW